MPLMPDHDQRKLSVREMINAQLFPLLPVEQLLRRWAGMAGAQQCQHQGAVTARPDHALMLLPHSDTFTK